MMKIKFNHFERVAGVFVLVAIVGLLFSMVGVSIKQGWFDSKTRFSTVFDTAEGIHSGTEVQVAGLRAGAVTDVELTSDNKIQVEFWVFSKFDSKIRKDSSVTLIRPFIIGERILDVSVGGEGEEELPPRSVIASRESMDFMTLMSGRTLGTYLASMNQALSSLRFLAEAFLDKGRTEGLVKTFDRIQPLLENVNTMSLEVIKLSKQATKEERLGKMMEGLAQVTTDKSLGEMIDNLALLTEKSKVLLPALAEVAPELPKSSRRALEALDEAVVLLKAMQKSFVLKGAAKEVREEELATQKKKESLDRKPAGE